MMNTYFLKICYALVLLLLHAAAGSIDGGSNRASRSGDVKCIEKERQALLNFKQSLIDDSGMLSTWTDDPNNRDCCSWKGVECSNETDHVKMLDLHGHSPDTPPYYYYYLSGDEINITSLIELQNLEYLDLSDNYFHGNQIPKHMDVFSNLRYLNLSYSYFGGRIPHQLGNLSKLESLDLSENSLVGAIPSQLGKLTHLRYLDLSGNYDIEGEIPYQLGNLSQLQYLDLGRTYLLGVIPFHVGNLPMLQTLKLGGYYFGESDLNTIDGEWLPSLTSLTILDLSSINLTSSHHWVQGVSKVLSNLKELRLSYCSISDNDIVSMFESHSNVSTSLTILDLSYNLLTSSAIFHWLSNFTTNLHLDFGKEMNSLEELDLSDNKLHGEIPAFFGNICTLRRLDLSGNNLSGEMSSFIQNSSWCNRHIFQSLDLSDNRITGLLPNLSIWPSLTDIDLSNNELNGEIPKSIGLLYELESLYLEGNSLEGDITELHFANLSNLKRLDFSDNSLSLKFGTMWVPPFQLFALGLASCKLGPSFPSWLQTQRYLDFLDISDAGLNDSVPLWFWNKLQSISVVNMSNNNLIGTIPNLQPKLIGENIYVLNSNQFEGRVPAFLLQATALDLSKNKISDLNSFLCGKSPMSNMLTLDLSDNEIEGQLSDCWGHLNSLQFLDLSNNKLSGKIPPSMATLVNLEALVLRNNSFIGELPSTLKNCTNLLILDVGDNLLSSSIPSWIGESLQHLTILSLRVNHFFGTLPLYLCYLRHIHLLDLSGNNLSGKIPTCLKNFTTMLENSIVSRQFVRERLLSSKVWNFDIYVSNAFLMWKGHEYLFKNPEFLLKSIDISSNHLSGEMPMEFGQLLGLVSLNLSRNSLSGEIPSEIGNLNSLEFLDLSINHFSGRIPSTLSQINRLTVLDLSDNSLSGKIPLGTQLQSFDPSKFEGNLDLCGKPLDKSCPEDERPIKPQGPATDNLDDNSIFYEALYMSLGIGFFTGFWSLIGPLLLWRPWRNAYMRLLNRLIDYAYVMILVNVARCQRWLNG